MGHTQCVSSAVWPENGAVYSASWDHSIRRWDIETEKDTINMVETLSREDLASRLTLTSDAASVGHLLLSNTLITIMDHPTFIF
ncbi:hypothetical protein LXL04_015301 [Taraxacum kok-saghyz]